MNQKKIQHTLHAYYNSAPHHMQHTHKFPHSTREEEERATEKKKREVLKAKWKRKYKDLI